MIEVIFETNGVRTTLHGSKNKTVHTQEANAAAKLECVVYQNDESFNNIIPFITDVQLYDTFKGDVIFEGTVHSIKPSASSSGASIEVTCVHLMARLAGECVVGFEDDSGSIRTMVTKILTVYNATALDKHKILMGTCPEGGHPDTVRIFSATCFDAITKIVVEDAKWDFKMSYRNGHWYLDISDDFGMMSTTEIIKGVNMTDISKTVDSTELYTRVIPIGGASYIPRTKVNPAMSSLYADEYKNIYTYAVGEIVSHQRAIYRCTTAVTEPEDFNNEKWEQVSTGMPLTLYKYRPYQQNDIFIANEKLEAKYPVKTKIVQYEDIFATDDTDFMDAQYKLYKKGLDDANALIDIVEAYEVKAIDLARAGYDYDSFELNGMYHISNPDIGVDTWLKVSSMRVDYSNPALSDLTFGDIGRTATRYLSSYKRNSDTQIKDVGSTAYATTNKRLDGISIRNTTTEAYEATTHDNQTLYVVKSNEWYEPVTENRNLRSAPSRSNNNDTVKLYFGDVEIAGGGGIQVGSAAILTTSTVEDFTVNREVMIDYSPATKVIYGAVPSFCLINGVYCLIGSFSASTVQTILDHRQYFGDSFSMPFYSYYSSTDHSYTGKVYSYLDSINTSGNWTAYSRFEDDYGRNSLSNVSFYNRPSVTEWFILPIIPTFVSVANMSTSLMSTTKRDALLAAGITMIPQYMNVGIIYKEAGVWKYDTNYRVSTLLYRGSSGYYAYPMWTRDEMDFALSVSQRVEPVTPTP